MAAASKDNFLDKPVGLCRVCPTTATSSSSSTSSSSGTSGTPPTGTCADVHGAYKTVNSVSSSQGCGQAPSECAVTQTDCKVSLACPGYYTSTEPTTIDKENKGSFKQSINIGGSTINADCALSFAASADTMKIDCQFSSPSGGGANCILTGTKK